MRPLRLLRHSLPCVCGARRSCFVPSARGWQKESLIHWDSDRSNRGAGFDDRGWRGPTCTAVTIFCCFSRHYFAAQGKWDPYSQKWDPYLARFGSLLIFLGKSCIMDVQMATEKESFMNVQEARTRYCPYVAAAAPNIFRPPKECKGLECVHGYTDAQGRFLCRLWPESKA